MEIGKLASKIVPERPKVSDVGRMVEQHLEDRLVMACCLERMGQFVLALDPRTNRIG